MAAERGNVTVCDGVVTDAGWIRAVSDKVNFSQEEVKILQFWREIDAFKTSLKLAEGRPLYSFYDGPPFATGLPHYGHLLAGSIKV